MERLYKKLESYGQSDYYPFHMPGHKRNRASSADDFLFERDITEISGFDNLHHAEGILKEAQEYAAQIYGTKKCFFSVNGSTAALLAAVSASVNKGGKILVARNCHKAVYHALYLRELQPVYIYPHEDQRLGINGGISPERVERYLEENTDVQAFLLTSPTYDGVVSDIKTIAEVVHRHKIPLIVDEAHGAHLGFHEAYPENSVQCGADVVIQSTHKTLPSPTQTAVLHVNGTLVNRDHLRKYLAIYQTSSPSYLLMTGIEEGLYLLEKEGEARLNKLLDMRRQLEKELASCKHVRICPYTEPSKIIISVKNTNFTGKQLYDLLREKYHLQLEMACETYALAMLSMMDTQEGIRRLVAALKDIDSESTSEKAPDFTSVSECWNPARKLPLYEAYMQESCEVLLRDAIGRTAAEFVNLYPPGIPLLVPGERIEEPFVRAIQERIGHGYTVQGINEGKVCVLLQDK